MSSEISIEINGDKISISKDGYWVGDGRIERGEVVDCAATLTEEEWTEIEYQIADAS